MNSLQSVRDSFVNLWGSMSAFWGIPPGTARVYGWLISRAESATAEEIMDGLEMSRGAVSMACRELRDWGLVHQDRDSGSRQARYRPETDLEKTIKNIIQARKRREWDPILEHLREAIPRLEGQHSAEAQVFRERLQAIESLIAMADDMADSFLKGSLVHSLGLRMLIANAGRKSRKVKR